MQWVYDLTQEPAVQEEVMVAVQDTASGHCTHALARLLWTTTEEDGDTQVLRWQLTADGSLITAPFEIYGWARFTQAIDRSAQDVPAAEEDAGEF